MNEEKKQHNNAAPEPIEEEFAGAVPPRKGKRRNCIFVPGTSNPQVAKLYAETMLKEILGEKHEEID